MGPSGANAPKEIFRLTGQHRELSEESSLRPRPAFHRQRFTWGFREQRGPAEDRGRLPKKRDLRKHSLEDSIILHSSTVFHPPTLGGRVPALAACIRRRPEAQLRCRGAEVLSERRRGGRFCLRCGRETMQKTVSLEARPLAKAAATCRLLASLGAWTSQRSRNGAGARGPATGSP